MPDQTIVMDADAIRAHLRRMAREIAEEHPDITSLVILGILSRGRPLADRLAAMLGEITGHTPPVGSLSAMLHRDDFHREGVSVKPRGHTHFSFSLDDRVVLLVDDVLAAGRTIRASLDEIMDYGRPRCIQLACLIDRGGRELPIQADYLGWRLATRAGEWVSVRLSEMDGEDAVLLEQRIEPSEHQEGA